MSEKTICEKCGAGMLPFKEFGSIGMKCPSCGWGWVTSYQDPIDLDQNNYTIYIPAQEPHVNAVKAIASAFNINYLEARKALVAGLLSVSGTAREILMKARILQNNHVTISIEPDFPYSIEEK